MCRRSRTPRQTSPTTTSSSFLIEGQTTKEIGDLLQLSPRTIEHRIDRLKTRFEARNLVHLVAKLVANQVGRKDRETA
ncbi:LuxR C-terminal-related transcriptional regulator [Neorhizobium turbinariae]|uniref:LuxR C-terminal-related transcriptional regulator n=1 Tax=Neorhizobium turbinariae TaxID=2937795 RepID=UPI0036F2F00B